MTPLSHLDRFIRIRYRLKKAHRHGPVEIRFGLSTIGQREQLKQTLREAIDLVATYSAKDSSRLSNSVRGLYVTALLGNAAEWRPHLRLILLDRQHLVDWGDSPDVVAAVLVHEATHAWLEDLGFSYDGDRQFRIEELCIKAEIAFVRKLPVHEHLLEDLHSQLNAVQETYGTQARLARAEATLADAHVPSWLARRVMARLRGHAT